MAATPNLGGMARVGYVLAGMALASWGLFGASASWAKLALLIVGGALIVKGLIGFCTVRWLLGRSSKTT